MNARQRQGFQAQKLRNDGISNQAKQTQKHRLSRGLYHDDIKQKRLGNQMTHTDASHLVRETAKSIERGQLILSEEMRNASTEYCETYRRNIPQLLNMAADLLDEAGRSVEVDANPDAQKTEALGCGDNESN